MSKTQDIENISQAIGHWSQGFISTQEMIDAASTRGYDLDRESGVIHATKRGAGADTHWNFSKRIG